MFSIEQLINIMKEKFGVTVKQNEVAEEGVLLYHDEIDESLISKEILNELPNPTQFNIYSINDNNEWIVGVAVESDTYDPLYLVCLKDGVRVHGQWFK